jgi:hypothetical protein
LITRLKDIYLKYLRRASTWAWRARGRLQAKTTIGNTTSTFCIEKKHFIIVRKNEKFTGIGGKEDVDNVGIIDVCICRMIDLSDNNL